MSGLHSPPLAAIKGSPAYCGANSPPLSQNIDALDLAVSKQKLTRHISLENLAGARTHRSPESGNSSSPESPQQTEERSPRRESSPGPNVYFLDTIHEAEGDVDSPIGSSWRRKKASPTPPPAEVTETTWWNCIWDCWSDIAYGLQQFFTSFLATQDSADTEETT